MHPCVYTISRIKQQCKQQNQKQNNTKPTKTNNKLLNHHQKYVVLCGFYQITKSSFLFEFFNKIINNFTNIWLCVVLCGFTNILSKSPTTYNT